MNTLLLSWLNQFASPHQVTFSSFILEEETTYTFENGDFLYVGPTPTGLRCGFFQISTFVSHPSIRRLFSAYIKLERVTY